MTLIAHPPVAEQPKPPRRSPRRAVVLAALVALAAGGLGLGLGVGLSGNSSTASSGTISNIPSGSMHSYYQSVMGRYNLGSMGGGMMGGPSNYGWMMGQQGYGWMMGGTAIPGWMTGGSLPGFMMGGNTDVGNVMGKLFADAPGARVSPADAAMLGSQMPSGAVIDRAANRLTFTGKTVHYAAIASPTGGPDETFRVAGLVNPTIVVPNGARVTIDVINSDPDTSHGLVVTSAQAPFSSMPMISAPPAFLGAAVWFLGNPTSAGMHEATLSFAASESGTYSYLCAVPGHAQKGMVGTFVVQ
ncbi:MAG TPA: sulfocyanin-like copper-binding protein [Acidothermaceae bacterium]